MVRAYSAADPADAQLACDLLNHHGVRAVVQGTSLWGVRGEIPATLSTAPSVWVNEEDVPQAKAILSQPRIAENAAWSPWVCPGCGQGIEGQFSDCRRCARTRRDEPAR